MMFHFFLLSFFFFYVTSAYDIDGSLRGLSRSVKPSFGRILLNSGYRVAIPTSDGSFHFSNVSAGTYFLEASFTRYIFEPVRIDVSAREDGKIHVSPLFRKENLRYPILLSPIQEHQYFQIRQTPSITGLLSNPMVLMISFTLILVVVFPMLLNKMDPQELSEFQKAQKEMSLSNLFGGKKNK